MTLHPIPLNLLIYEEFFISFLSVYPLTEESLEEEGGEEPGYAHQHRDECTNLKRTEYVMQYK
jgi:hypothetical protein